MCVPEYATPGSACFDVRACLKFDPQTLLPGEIKKIGCGFQIELPDLHRMMIVSRSGLASKGLIVANSPGIVDCDYRGEICVLLRNVSELPLTIHNGDRIAQSWIEPYQKVNFNLVTRLSETQRKNRGFGSTGTQ